MQVKFSSYGTWLKPWTPAGTSTAKVEPQIEP